MEEAMVKLQNTKQVASKELTTLRAKELAFDEQLQYLQAELRDSVAETKALRVQLSHVTQEKEFIEKKQQVAFEEAMTRIRLENEAREQRLSEVNRKLKEEVVDLSLFKEMRQQLTKELVATKNIIAQHQRKHKEELDELDRKLLAAREKLEADANAKIAHNRRVYKEEVGRELDQESQRVRAENRQMIQELKFHVETSNRLQKENQIMTEEVKRSKMDISLTKQLDQESARRSL
jgi:hypothetical protein